VRCAHERDASIDPSKFGAGNVLHAIGYTVVCLALPVLWGVFVNWLFQFWRTRSADNNSDEPIFPDYQI